MTFAVPKGVNPFRRLLAARDRGVAALEFALVAPVMIIAFAGVIDLGLALYIRISLESALAAGTNYALVNNSQVGSNGATFAAKIATIVTTSLPGMTPNGTIVVNNGPTVVVSNGTQTASGTPNTGYYCLAGSPSNWTWNTSSQGTTCSGGGNAGQFVTITASYNFNSFFPAYGFVSNGAISVGAAVQTTQ